MITNDDVKEFQTLFRNRFGSDISFDRAYEGLIKLVTLMKLIYKPITTTDYQRAQKRFKELGISIDNNFLKRGGERYGNNSKLCSNYCSRYSQYGYRFFVVFTNGFR